MSKYNFLLPAFKSPFLKEALLSLQAQTFRDFSVIISDDCSPEPLFEIVHPFLSDPRFSYRKNESNIGGKHLVSHWNLLLADCHSPYLIVAGDDDLYEPTFLEEMDKLISRFPEVDLFRSRMELIDSTGKGIRTENSFKSFEESSTFVQALFDSTHLHAVGQFVFKTEILKRLGGFKDFPLAWFSDDATAILCSKNGVVHSSDVLFHFRVSDYNISGQKGSPYLDRLKGKATILFYRWFSTCYKGRMTRKPCRDYCCSILRKIWSNVSVILKFETLLTFPILGYRLMRSRVRGIIDWGLCK